MAHDEVHDQAYLGYFATLLLALMIANWMGEALAVYMPWAEPAAGGTSPAPLITAAIFFGLCFANPAAAILHGIDPKSLVLRLAAGLCFGAAFQLGLVAPYIGEALARFAMLFTAALGIPVMMISHHFSRLQRDRNNHASTEPS